MPRDAMMFVDGQNMFHGAKNYDPDYDYDATRLLEVLTDGYDTIRAYWFDSYPEGNNNKQGFFHYLNMNGYQVIATPLRERDGEMIEKGVDIRLATELLAHGFNDSYETAILVSGDDDYIRAIEYVQSLGKQVVVATWSSNSGGEIKPKSDEFFELDEIAGAIER